MRTKKDIKAFVIIIILCITSILIYGSRRPHKEINKPPLIGFLTQLEGYKINQLISLASEHITMLKLDDYVFVDYKGSEGQPNLFIGYYYTASKAYAAHSPLICYPSQGWEIDNKPQIHSLQLGTNIINYEEITTSLGPKKELVLYWYQAGRQTNTQIYKNKIDMGYNKLMNNDEQHGFVRVAIPLTTSYEESKTIATDFIKVFYPPFLDYISL